MNTRPVYRSLTMPMTLLGVERRLFFCILAGSFALFHFTEALLPAVVCFAVLLVTARAATQYDTQFVEVLLRSRHFAARYDPAIPPKHEGRPWSR